MVQKQKHLKMFKKYFGTKIAFTKTTTTTQQQQ